MERRNKRSDPLRKPAPAIVPTELPVFGELERLGLVVPVSQKESAKSGRKAQKTRRRG